MDDLPPLVGAPPLPAAPSRRVRGRGRRERTGLGKSLLMVVLALLYPFHMVVLGRADPRHPGGVNVSLGDGVVALIPVILVFRLAVGWIPFPRYLRHVLVFLGVIATSVTLNAVAPAPFFFLRDSEVEAVKFVASAMWMIAVFWLLYDEFPRRFLQFACLSVALATGFAIATVIENIFLHVARPSGSFANPNLYGHYLILNIFLALAADRLLSETAVLAPTLLVCVLRKLRLPLRLVVGPALLLGLLASGSRGALLGFCLGVPAAIPSSALRRLNLRRVGAVLVACLVLGAALAWYVDQHPFLLKRIAKTTEGDPNVTERLALWGAARDAWISHPLLGIGYGQFPGYSQGVQGLRATVTHDTFLSAAGELGTVGLVVFLWLLGAPIRDGWRTRLGTGNGVGRSLCAFVLATAGQGLFENVDQFRALWIGLGVLAALTTHVTRSRGAQPAGGSGRRVWFPRNGLGIS